MNPIDRLPLQAVVFLVAAAAFSSVYITQPVLPVLAGEFGATAFEVSLTVSAVILGIAISILPFGILSDHAPVHRILLAGGLIVALCCLFAALTHSLWTLVAFASFFVFSSVFNFLPFYLAAPLVSLPLQFITALYLTYVIGIVIGPLAGRANNRFGSGLTMAGGALLLGVGLALSLLPSLAAIGLALAAICAGYFGVQASAVGTLNLRLSSGRGRANALYVLFYYAGGFSGITVSGFAYAQGGWTAVVMVCAVMLAVPGASGLVEHRAKNAGSE